MYPCKPLFYYLKKGFKGVTFTSACYLDGGGPKLGLLSNGMSCLKSG